LQYQLTVYLIQVYKSWDPNALGTCLPVGPSFKGYAIVSIVSDIIVTVMLIPFLVKSNIKRGQKISLCAVFLLGVFTTMCSILRYKQIDRVAFGDGNSTLLVLWGIIEFNVGVSYHFTFLSLIVEQNVVTSLPFLAPVIRRKANEYRSRHTDDCELASKANVHPASEDITVGYKN
jgi:hypothetical protein